MATLKASKTSMYKLIRDKGDQFEVSFPWPANRKGVSFRETASKSYIMTWNLWHRRYCFCLMASLGRPLLIVEVWEDGKQTKRDVVTLDTQELRSRGMVDDSQ